MTAGDIKFVRIPIILDSKPGTADTILQDAVTDLFPEDDWSIISVKILDVTGNSGKRKCVMIIVGRELSGPGNSDDAPGQNDDD